MIFGFAYGGWAVQLPALVADYFGLRATGAILGFMLFVVSFGTAGGPLVAGRIFDITGAYYYAILMCIALSVVALIVAFWVKAPRR